MGTLGNVWEHEGNVWEHGGNVWEHGGNVFYSFYKITRRKLKRGNSLLFRSVMMA